MIRMIPGLMSVVILFATTTPGSTAPVKDEEPFASGTKWKGKLTQKGEIGGTEVPLDLDAVLTVTKRDGAAFEAELFEDGGEDSGIKLTYLVRGEIARAKGGKGYTVNFKSYDFKDARSQTFLNIPYTGTLTGKTLKGTWKHPKNDDGTTIEGEFTLELVK